MMQKQGSRVKQMKKRGLLAGIPVAAVVSIALLAGCGRPGGDAAANGEKKEGGAPAAGAATQNAADVAVPVRVAEAKRETVTRSLPVTGNVAALQTVELSARVSAKVISVAGREGAAVRQGQVVVQQDTTDFQAQLEQAQANLASARANLKSSEARLAQAETQVKLQRTTSEAGVQDAEQQLKSAQAQLELAKRPQRTQEINVAENNVAQAQANYDKAKSDRERYDMLVKEGAAAQITLDQYVNQERVAKAALDSAQEQLKIAREGGREASIRNAETAVSRAQWQVRLAKSNRAQNQVREDDVKAARAAVAQAKATIQQNEAAVTLARQSVINAAIRSPIDGVISERLTEPGQQAAPGGAVLRLVALDTVFFEAKVPETDIATIQAGMPVDVKVDAYPGRSFKGKVARIYPTGSTASRTFNVRVEIPNGGKLLRPGLFARGQVIAGQWPGIVISKDALVAGDTGFAVFVATPDGKAVRRNIKTGVETDQTVEVLSGVREGEMVVIAGQGTLKDGSKIDVKNSDAQPRQAAAAL
jgi:HlyD family secretion protein